MWIVRLALRRPYTFVVMALLIVILGVLTIVRTPIDIFPEINIPVVSVIWNYSGLSPQEMEGRIVTISERAMTTTVNDIEHIESQSLNGADRRRCHPRLLPARRQDRGRGRPGDGDQPDAAARPAAGHDAAAHHPLHRLQRPDPAARRSQRRRSASSSSTTTASTSSAPSSPPCRARRCRCPTAASRGRSWSTSTPTRSTRRACRRRTCRTPSTRRTSSCPPAPPRWAPTEYNVRTNSSPDVLEHAQRHPGQADRRRATVYLRDVAQVHDGFAVQTTMVHVDGRRSALLTVLKTANASTLDIVQRVRDALPRIQATLPPELSVKPLFDQSVFVRAALDGVLTRGADRRRADRPHDPALPRLVAPHARDRRLDPALDPGVDHRVLARSARRSTSMTLGGLALAVGILVDDATVEIENIHRNLAHGQAGHPRDPRRRAADRGAGVRLDAVHLHRVRAGRLPHRRRQVSLHAARAGGRLRDARQLLPVAHARADDGAVPAAGRGASARARAPRRRPTAAGSGRVHQALQPPLRALPGRLRALRSAGRSPTGGIVVAVFVGARAVSLAPLPAARQGLLPHASTPGSSACTCAPRRHAHRGDRARASPRSSR